jgi:aryl-alcohol dehydrogenase-like predicted oxidoreductase
MRKSFAATMLTIDADALMNAVNVVDRHTYAFEELVWPLARKKKVGLAAMKVFGGGITACKMPAELREASFRWVQSVQGVTLAVIGMGSEKELEQNVGWAKTYKPMGEEEAEELKKKTVALAKEWGAHLDRLDAKGEKERPLRNT